MSGVLLTNDYERIPVEDLKHIFKKMRQTRGIPWTHSVMIYMEDLDDFNQACLCNKSRCCIFNLFRKTSKEQKLVISLIMKRMGLYKRNGIRSK